MTSHVCWEKLPSPTQINQINKVKEHKEINVRPLLSTSMTLLINPLNLLKSTITNLENISQT